MPARSLLPLPEGLEITAMSKTIEGLLISVTSYRISSVCPLGGTPSEAVHSSYRRRPLDLPCAGQTIRLQLSVRKFFCRVSTCQRKVFTERLPEWVAPSSRMTKRLRTVVQAIGFAFNGQGGSRLATHLGIEVSRVSIHKSLYLVPAPTIGQVKEVGIDDFAWKRGKRYGTIIVRKRLKMPAPSPPGDDQETHGVEGQPIEVKETKREQRTQAVREHKQEQHEQIWRLAELGMSIHGIAPHLGIARNPVRAHLRMGEELIVAGRPKKRSILDPYYDYIVERWKQGCTNGQQILREIRAKGYRGSATTARTITTRLRKQLPGMAHPPKHTNEGKCSYRPRELRWLLAKRSTDLAREEQADLTRWLESSEEVKTVYQLLQDFLVMLGQRRADRLKAWMKAAQNSGIKELRSFVAGVERDYDAVSAGLSLPWSQGVVEGTINKLKTHKRLMYGRASFHLLRQKLLHPI